MINNKESTTPEIIEIVREADKLFEKIGGSSRHWVRDCFMPLLEKKGFVITRTAPQNAKALEKMVKALKMVVHNAAIRSGKKGKAWDGDFVIKECQSALTEYLAAQDGRCPDCGYTEEDKKLHGDHHLCPRAALNQPRTAIEWQPIETAPKDGTEILGFMPSYYQGKGGMKTLCWMNFTDRPGWYGGVVEPHDPTHWMPLPEQPAQLAAQEGGAG